jgi:hypothetical protein
MAAAALKGIGVWGDEMYSSTDLNRRSAEVLDHARLRPVTISRKNEHFALLRREQAAGLIQAVCHLKEVIELFGGVLSLRNGGAVPPSLAWLEAFNVDDRAKMCQEVVVAITRAMNTEDWGEVDAAIHEWRESAAVIQSGIFEEAMNSKRDEAPLTNPEEVEQQESEPVAVPGTETLCPR